MNASPAAARPVEDHCDVLVLGAGPAGLALAVDLARRGVDVRVVGRSRHSTVSDRADLGPEGLAVLDDLGILDQVRQVGAVRLDEVLRVRLSGLGVEVSRGWELVGLSPDEDGVTVRLHGVGGAVTWLRARYLVGADGDQHGLRERLRRDAGVEVGEAARIGRVIVAGPGVFPVAAPGESPPVETALADAHNLGWKLAAVLHGVASTLLETYEIERRAGLSALAGGGPAGSGVPDVQGNKPWIAGLARRLRRRSDATTAHYRRSPLSQELGGRRSVVRAGDPMPDVRLWSIASAAEVRLHDVLRGTRWTLLGLGSVTAEAVAATRHRFGAAVHGAVIGGGFSAVPGVTLLDRYGEARRRLGRHGGTVFVVRPDGYLGLRCGGNTEIIAAYLDDMVTAEF